MHMTPESRKGQAIARVKDITANAKGRVMTSSEKSEVEDRLAEARGAQDEIELNRSVDDIGKGNGSFGPSLSKALQSEGYDRKGHSDVRVPFTSVIFGAKAASITGGADDSSRSDVTSPPLGADQRFLYPALRQDGVDSEATSVTTFRQKARTLADPDLMDRAIAAVTEKPETDTEAELVIEALHQIATISKEVPNIFLENQAFRGFIDADLRLAFSNALDKHILDAIAASTPQSGTGNALFIEAILHAAEAVAADGYSPSLLAASPADLIRLKMHEQPSSGDYIGSGVNEMLGDLKRVAVKGLAQPMVLDPAALGTLYLSPVRFASFEENAGATNSSTVRVEANGLFVVQREDAVALVDETP